MGSRQWGRRNRCPVTCFQRAHVLYPRSPGPSSLQPSQWREMEIPRRRFLGYRSLATAPHPPLAVARNLPGACLGTHHPSPYSKAGGEREPGAAQLWASPSYHGNLAIGTRLAHPTPQPHSPEHKGPGGHALSLDLRLSEMGMRSPWSLLAGLWPLDGSALQLFQP